MSSSNNSHLVDYTQHNGIWLPHDLKAGDIIRCRMLTKHDGLDEAEMCPRHVLVLGFEMDPEKLEYTAINVARFSYTSKYCRDDMSYLIPGYMQRKGWISGIDTPAVLQIDRTDFLPLDQDHFYGDVVDIERLGSVAPQLLKEICESLGEGITKFRTPSRYAKRDQSMWYVPAMNLVNDQNVINPHPFEEYSSLDDIDLARIQIGWALRQDTEKLDGAYITKCLVQMERARQALARHQAWENRQKNKTQVHEPFEIDLSRRFSAALPVPQEDAEAIPDISPEDSFMMLLPRATAEQYATFKDLTAKFKDQAHQSPAFRLELPTHLWQGRYLMMRIADLHDDENDGLAYRPCAVWKAYADKNSGELAGLELHPVTRTSANSFRYKFQVHPLDGASKNPSFLIGDCIIRVPLDERYFHAKPSQYFYELPPDKIAKFTDRREHAMTSGDQVTIYGLKEIPENWMEVELDPTPSYQQFVKWSETRQIRFDGAINDNKRGREAAHKRAKDRHKERAQVSQP